MGVLPVIIHLIFGFSSTHRAIGVPPFMENPVFNHGATANEAWFRRCNPQRSWRMV